MKHLKNDKTVYCSNLDIGYGTKTIMSQINLSASKGEQIVLIGANGIGKSTLLRTLCGIQESLSGMVLLVGKKPDAYSIKEKAKIISFVGTKPLLDRYMTAEELIRLGRFPHTGLSGKLSEQDIEPIEKAIHTVGIDSLRHRRIIEMSDGERQKALIARALAQDTQIVVLDEPVSFLDPENSFAVLAILKNLSEAQNKTVIYSGHNITCALNRADKIWLLKGDKILEGAPEDLIFSGAFDDLFYLPKMVFDRDTGSYQHKKPFDKKLYLENRSNNSTLENGINRTAKRLNCEMIKNDKNTPPNIIIDKDSKILVFKETETVAVNNFYELAKSLRKML